MLRAQAAFQLRRDADATAMLLDAAGRQEPGLAREVYLQALSATMFLDREPGRLQDLASRIRATAPRRNPARPVDLLLDALIDQATLPAGDAVPSMRRALTGFCDDSSGDHRWIELASLVALDLLDDEALRLLTDRQVHLARSQGALADLPQALNMQAFARATLGDLDHAAASLAEAHAVEAATGNVGMASGDFLLAAWRGDAPAMETVMGRAADAAAPSEPGAALYARAVLANGLGDYEAALGAAELARSHELAGSYVPWHLGAELVEAAVHAARPGPAREVLGVIVARASASGTDWAVGTALQCQALVADDSDAGAFYKEAVERFRRSHVGCSTPGRSCCTASGCAVEAGAWRPANSSAKPSRRCRQWESQASPRERASSCSPRRAPAAARHGAPGRPDRARAQHRSARRLGGHVEGGRRRTVS